VHTDELTLASTDLLVEGIHFDFAYSEPQDVGFKCIAVNVSDIAAMGGRASTALVSLGAPAETSLALWDGVVAGMIEAAGACGVAIAGGDCSVAPVLTINVAVLGRPSTSGIVARSGARPGDLLCVTGALGAAAAGLELLRSAGPDPFLRALLEQFPDLAKSHRRPPLRGAAGQAAAVAGATAMIDISDGLARDACHIAEASRCGVVIRAEKIPLAPGVAEVASALDVDSMRLAAGGGEDYELAIAIPAAAEPALAAAIAPLPLTVVGEFGGSERVLRSADEAVPLDKLGWEHFT
jgi:thiamine-monophosphate kinase